MDMDYFFFYGTVEERAEIEADLKIGLMQDKRSMFYNRSFGAGVPDYENTAGGLAADVALRYSIASWISRRNSEVSDGSNGTRDRRVLASQSAIQISQSPGNIDIKVLYVPYFDYQKPSVITIPLAG